MLPSLVREIVSAGLPQTKSNRGRPLRRLRLRIEGLEQRNLLAVHFVDDDLADRPDAGFQSIQAAVDAAQPGDRIRVYPGTYQEQVTIPDTKDGIDLRSVDLEAAVIEAPPAMTEPGIVHVAGADDVLIRGFTITGPFSSVSTLRSGIFVGGGGSARIVENHITAIRAEPLSGAQTGFGILVGRGSTGEVGSATILRNTIDDYQKGGIVVDAAGSSAVIGRNEILGAGPTATIAQNGIQVSRGATAEVHHNRVAGNVYTGSSASAAGILLFQAGEVTVERNTVEDNGVGISVDETLGATIARNHVAGNTDAGLLLFLATAADVFDNLVTDNGGHGIALEGSDGNEISDNRTIGNGSDGVNLTDSNSNRVDNNRSRENGRDGIHVTGLSANNSIRRNEMRDNAVFDCFDDTVGAGTANFWSQNTGETENRAGLCRPRGRGRR